MTSSSPPPVPFTAYQRRLFVFLGVATFFEGYDFIAISQLLPTCVPPWGSRRDRVRP